jgi:NAD+ synthase
MIGCRHEIIPIQPAVEGFDAMLAGASPTRKVDITEENLQSRIRGVTLMRSPTSSGDAADHRNKSEMSVGYATIYGDMAGGYNPLKDAYKTRCSRSAMAQPAPSQDRHGSDGR